MKIGIVTVTYNSQEVLKDFFQSIEQQDYHNFEIIIIDNDSKDKTLEMINEWSFKSKMIIQNTQNIGIAGANNQGITLAIKNQCDFILLLNNDTVFETTLLSKLLQTAQLYSCSAVAPKMNYFSPSDMIWYAGGFFNPFKAYLNYHRGQGEKDTHQYSVDDVVKYAPTCCLLIHKKVFEDIGLMDEKYFVYFEDTDFVID